MTQTLPVIRTLGGCGGTLVSRLFAALPGTTVLSETNPRSASLFAGELNPLAQLRKWRPALLEKVTDFDDAEIGYPPRFGEMLERLLATAEETGRRLVVRDFNYVDFIGAPFVWPPPCNCSLDLAASGRFEIRDLVLVRHPADQLASLRTHDSLNHILTAELFLDGCRAFLADRASTPRFRYEDLTAAPAATLLSMCETLGLEFDATALVAFEHVTEVTGNLARAGEQGISAPARSKTGLQAEAELSALPDYPALLALLGYDQPRAEA